MTQVLCSKGAFQTTSCASRHTQTRSLYASGRMHTQSNNKSCQSRTHTHTAGGGYFLPRAWISCWIIEYGSSVNSESGIRQKRDKPQPYFYPVLMQIFKVCNNKLWIETLDIPGIISQLQNGSELWVFFFGSQGHWASGGWALLPEYIRMFTQATNQQGTFGFLRTRAARRRHLRHAWLESSGWLQTII